MREGIYFAENGEFTHRQFVDAVSSVLVAKGLVKQAEPMPFAEDEYKQMPLVSCDSITDQFFVFKFFLIQLGFFGTNARSRADRSRALGWRPIETEKDMLNSIEPELDALMKNM